LTVPKVNIKIIFIVSKMKLLLSNLVEELAKFCKNSFDCCRQSQEELCS
jgi:hypothetical protein